MNFTIFNSDSKKIDYLNLIPPKLTDTQTIENQYGVKIRGKLDNYNVYVSKNKVDFNNASINKYGKKENVSPFKYKEFCDAISQMCDTTSLYLPDATVSRLHYAIPSVVKYSPNLYMNYMGELPYYQRFASTYGLNYQQLGREKEFAMYDKYRESKRKRAYIPEYYLDKNILRLEYRWNKNLARALEYKPLYIRDLLECDTYMKIHNLVEQTYFQINKLKTTNYDFSKVKTASKVKDLAMYDYIIKNGGLSECLHQVKEMQKKDELTKSNAQKIKKMYKRCATLPFTTCENELISEIDYAIRNSKDLIF